MATGRSRVIHRRNEGLLMAILYGCSIMEIESKKYRGNYSHKNTHSYNTQLKCMESSKGRKSANKNEGNIGLLCRVLPRQ